VPEIAALITVLIIERPMCVSCIASRAQIGEATVRSYLLRMTSMLHVNLHADERCRTCGRQGQAFSLDRDPNR
jgi:hypothetical protein